MCLVRIINLVSFCFSNWNLSLFMYGRSRRYSGDGRVQHRKRLGKRELHPGRPEDESKFKMILRPLGFTVMVGYDKGLLHLRT